MLKKFVLLAAVAGFTAGALIPIATPAEAGKSGCFKAAKMKFPADAKARHSYRKWCRSEWKAYKARAKTAS